MARATIFIEGEPPVVIDSRSRRLAHLSHGLVAEHASGADGGVTLFIQQIEPGSNPPSFKEGAMFPLHDFTDIGPGRIRASPEAIYDEDLHHQWKLIRIDHKAKRHRTTPIKEKGNV